MILRKNNNWWNSFIYFQRIYEEIQSFRGCILLITWEITNIKLSQSPSRIQFLKLIVNKYFRTWHLEYIFLPQISRNYPDFRIKILKKDNFFICSRSI